MNRFIPLAFTLVLPVAANSADHLGTPAPAKAADRTVVVKPGTKYINADRGDVVTVVHGDKSFTWEFDTFGAPNFALKEIAPGDFGTGHVRVYVSDRYDDK